ncbi:MAG: redox-regulated ATPase YchF [Deltaproteobacteria bacterium]|nr:MAG: redox-regulated ATPase YchF [Deltaproteobacteria bacterium]
MEVGIFGNAGSGKSTLFRALSGGGEAASHGKQAGVCAIKVPDERVDRLAEIFKPKKTTHVSISFHDIDAGEPDLLSTQAIAAIKGVEVLALVVRGFSDDYHPAPPGGLDPVSEFREIASALVLSDYLVAQKRIERMTKEARRDAEWTALNKAVSALEKEVPLRHVELVGEEERALAGFRFLSRIPLLLVLNVGEDAVRSNAYPELSGAAAEAKVPLVRLCAGVEEEIARLSQAEQVEFLSEMGIERSARDRLVRGAFDAMHYISFLTVGEDEVRAWNIRRGSTAVTAAGRIHSDLEKGFIRAEVIPSDDFLRCGTMAKAKTEGKLRLEGKEYVVRDGDIVHVRFNV